MRSASSPLCKNVQLLFSILRFSNLLGFCNAVLDCFSIRAFVYRFDKKYINTPIGEVKKMVNVLVAC